MWADLVSVVLSMSSRWPSHKLSVGRVLHMPEWRQRAAYWGGAAATMRRPGARRAPRRGQRAGPADRPASHRLQCRQRRGGQPPLLGRCPAIRPNSPVCGLRRAAARPASGRDGSCQARLAGVPAAGQHGDVRRDDRGGDHDGHPLAPARWHVRSPCAPAHGAAPSAGAEPGQVLPAAVGPAAAATAPQPLAGRRAGVRPAPVHAAAAAPCWRAGPLGRHRHDAVHCDIGVLGSVGCCLIEVGGIVALARRPVCAFVERVCVMCCTRRHVVQPKDPAAKPAARIQQEAPEWPEARQRLHRAPAGRLLRNTSCCDGLTLPSNLEIIAVCASTETRPRPAAFSLQPQPPASSLQPSVVLVNRRSIS